MELMYMMELENISIKVCEKSELDSGLPGILTDEEKQNIRNPGKEGSFWLGSGNTNDSYRVWRVESNGNLERYI